MKLKLSVIGLGKLGASMAAVFASKGFQVIGVDINRSAVDLLNRGLPPVQETDLDRYITENKDRLRGTTSHAEAVFGSDISFVIVPTPSDERGAFSLQYASWAFKEIGKAIKKKDKYHNVVLTSTVLPGATRYGLLPILEQESGKKCGADFGLCYSPEFIALGSIIHDYLHPDFVLLGQFDDRCGSQLEQVYKQVVENKAVCKRMSLENAELTKISLNAFVTSKITFANMMAEMCEQIPGGDVDIVSDALGSDSRVGRKYLTGGLGYGGPCFPRDNVALAFMARTLGLTAAISETTDQQNRKIPEKIVGFLKPQIRKGQTIALLGLAYKPFSHVVEESQGLLIAQALSDAGMRVVCYDALAADTARAELRDKSMILDSMETCLEQADVVLVATPDPMFKALRPEQVLTPEKKLVIVVDFWRILPSEFSRHPRIKYIPYGRSIEDEGNVKRLQGLWGATAGGVE